MIEFAEFQKSITIGREKFLFSIIHDISDRIFLEKEKEELIDRLQTSLSRVKQLSGLLPICASCKNIRDDKGYWNKIKCYITENSDADFSHGICPECAKKLYPKLKRHQKKE